MGEPIAWISVSQAAETLGLDPTAVYRLCRVRKIAHRRIGAGNGRIVFTRADLDEYLESCRVPVGEQEVRSGPVRLRHFEPQGYRRA